MAALTTNKNGTIVISALRARANFGKLLPRNQRDAQGVLISIRDYVKRSW
jgi:hypothetical protein